MTNRQKVNEFNTKFKHEINIYKGEMRAIKNATSVDKKSGETGERELMLSQILFRHSRFLISEVAEFTEAAQQNDIVEMVDGLVDLQYFIEHISIVLGVDLQPIFDAVHTANMQKSLGKDAGGKTIKGKDWKEADVAGLLRAQGFDV